MLGLSRIQQNPFAIKTTTPTRSVADSTENKETKPIVAPPTLVLGADNACAVSSSGSRIVLRPSALAFQAEKLKQASTDTASSESKEGASAPATTKDQQSTSSSKDPREVSSTCESSGSPVTNGGGGSGGGRTTGRASAESVVEDDNSGSATASSSGRTTNSSIGGAEGTSGFGSALVDLRNGTSSSEHATAGLGGGSGFLSSAADDAIHSPPAPPDGFVFGENLRERAANFDDGSSDSSVPSSTELSFQRFQQAGQSSASASTEQPADLSSSAASRHAKSLTESAEEYQLRQVKRTYDEVAVVTGEENESNVLQINCKLFTFDKGTASWHERGRGNLRLNDQEVDGALQSRMVMRTQGSLRVILNTKVWAGMVVEHPSPKTVRTTATDPDGIRVYLIQANPKDAEQLYSALECRVASLKSAEDSTSPSPTLATQGLPPSADSSSSFPESAGSAEEEGGAPPRAKRPRLQESDGSSLPDSSHGEEDSIPTAECESSAEEKG